MKKAHIGLAVLAAVFLADILLFVLRPLGEDFFIITDLAVVLFSFAAFIFGMRACKLHGFRSMQGKALLFLSLGILFWFLGESLWAIYEIILGINDPLASLADLMWIIGYPLFFTGLYYEWKVAGIPVAKDRRFILVFLSILIFTIIGLFRAVPTMTSLEMSYLEKAVSVSYVIGDMVLLLMCSAIIVSFISGKFTIPWIIITSGLLLSALADTGYSFLSTAYQTGNPIDLLWDFDYLLLAYGFFYYRQSIQGMSKKAV